MGLIKTAGKVAVASAVHGRVQRRQQLRWAAQDNAQVSTQPAASGGIRRPPSWRIWRSWVSCGPQGS